MDKLEDLVLKVLSPEQLVWGAVLVLLLLGSVELIARIAAAAAGPDGQSWFHRTALGRVSLVLMPLVLSFPGGWLLRAAGVFPPWLWLLFGPLAAMVAMIAWKVWHDNGATITAWVKRRLGIGDAP